VTVSTSHKESPLELCLSVVISCLRIITRAGARGGGGAIVNVGILLSAQGRATDTSSGMSSGVEGSQGSGAGWGCGSCW